MANYGLADSSALSFPGRSSLTLGIKPLIWAVVVLLVVTALFPTYRLYKRHRVELFNTALYEARTQLKKEDNYKAILDRFSDMPAVNLARIELASFYLENNDHAAALGLLKEGLSVAKSWTVVETQMLTRLVALYLSDKQPQQAVDVIDQYRAKLQPKTKLAFVQLQSTIQADAGQYDQAIASLQLMIDQLQSTVSNAPDAKPNTELDVLQKQQRDIQLIRALSAKDKEAKQ